MNIAKKLSVVIPAILGTLSYSSLSLGEDLRLEEIIVTAQKRQESLQEVPIAVSALSSEGIKRANVQTIQDLSNVFSGIKVTNINVYILPVIRGTGSMVSSPGIYNAVASYVDGHYMSRNYSSNASIEEASRVQVLKGPQGALYGRNATAGAIIVDTFTPEVGDPVSGKFSMGVGERDENKISARLSGSLGDKLAVSLSGYRNEVDGDIDVLPASQNAQEDTLGGREEYGGTLKVVFKPTDNVELKGHITHTQFNSRYGSWDVVAEGEVLSAERIAAINPNLAPYAATFAANGFNSAEVAMADLLINSLGFPAADAIGLAPTFGYSSKFGTGHENIINGCELGNLTGLDAGCDKGSHNNVVDTIYGLEVNVNFDRFDLYSYTGYRDGSYSGTAELYDLDPSSFGGQVLSQALMAGGLSGNIGVGFHGEFLSEDVQQEIRFSSNDTWNWQWTAGLHYFKEKGPEHVLNGAAFGTYVEAGRHHWYSKSVSAFGQATFPLTEKLSLTAGTRYAEDEYQLVDEIDHSGTNPLRPLTASVAAVGPLGTIEEGAYASTYLLRLEYKADDWMVYGGTSTGFKSGGLNTEGPAFGVAKPEELTAYEIGFKSEWREGTLQVNGAVFYYDYENPHVSFVDNSSGGLLLLNIDEATTTGAELEFVGVLGDNLNWFANMTVTDAEFKDDAVFTTDFVGSGSNIVSVDSVLATKGKQMPSSSPFTAALGFDYRMTVGDFADLYFSPSVAYNDGVWYDPENRSGSGGGASDASYTVANMNIRLVPYEGGWTATLWAKNLTDEEYYQGGTNTNGFMLAGMPADGRQIGATLTYEF